MIPLEKIQGVTRLITHDKCSDGMASAMIVKNVLPSVSVEFVQYNTVAHKELEVTPGMLFCDFSPHPERVREFLDAGAIVLDHHKSAREIVEPFIEAGLGAFGDEVADPGVCGAVLAFREIWEPVFRHYQGGLPVERWQEIDRSAVEKLATLAGIRDTWQKHDPRWEEACAQSNALFFWPPERLLNSAVMAWPFLLDIGPVLFAKNLEKAANYAANAYRFVTAGGLRVAMFMSNNVSASSDAAEILGQEADLVIGFSVGLNDTKVPGMTFSCRTRGNFNASALALAHGGGGHTNAAGFRVLLASSDPQPFELARRLLERYETVLPKWLAVLDKGRPEDPVAAYEALF